MMRRVSWILSLALIATSAWSSDSGLNQLQAFLSLAKSGDYTFEQTVTGPSAKASKLLVQKGRMRFIRPLRFRFDYVSPYPQTIVADGSQLWLYDPDLEQVTVKNQEAMLAESPAGLLASATDVRQLQQHFELYELTPRDGLSWVKAKPKNNQAVLTEVNVGLKSNQLAVLELTDAMGQRSRLEFKIVSVNQPPSNDVFKFTPPKGADLIKQ